MAKVNDTTIALILALSATQSNREIESELARQGIKLSRTTIGKIINEHRQERAATTKETINEHIKHTVTTDLDILQKQRDKLYEWFNDDGLRISERLMCSDRLNKVIDTRLKYSGAEELDEKDRTLHIKWGDDDG